MKKYPFFEIDFLSCKIHVIFDKKWREIAGKIVQQDVNISETANAAALMAGRDFYILSDLNVKDSIICHECMHILMCIYDDFDIKFDVDNQEPAAYLIEYIIDNALRIKREYKRKKKR